jgi:uncharacterized protein YcaQ
MIYGHEMIGRVEAAADRKEQRLILKNIWLEPGVRASQKLNRAIEASVQRLARFNECTYSGTENLPIRP